MVFLLLQVSLVPGPFSIVGGTSAAFVLTLTFSFPGSSVLCTKWFSHKRVFGWGKWEGKVFACKTWINQSDISVS